MYQRQMEAAMEAVRIIEEEHGVTMALGSVCAFYWALWGVYSASRFKIGDQKI